MKKFYTTIAGITLCCILFLYLFLGNNSVLSGQIADAILRPLLGSQKTIFLESVYFNSLDKITSLFYHVDPHASTTLAPTIKKVNVASQVNVDNMNLQPLSPNHALPALLGEGVWTPIPENLFPNQEVMAQTFFRPDPDRPYAIASLVKMDMHKLNIGIQAGTYYPGGSHHEYGPGIVPTTIQMANILVAAFNGGFQEKDGAYGMTVGSIVYVPLKPNLPALIIFQDGSAQFATYYGQSFTKDILAIRQNGPYLVENSKITPYVELGQDSWGRTITNSIYTWRSGLGMTKNGNLVYAAGNSLIPKTLAEALLAAGAVNAIQLDINPPWVRFVTYQSLGNGRYTYAPLLSSMQNGGYAYLHGYNKDFFYIYKQ